jgi:hypothetical protein
MSTVFDLPFERTRSSIIQQIGIEFKISDGKGIYSQSSEKLFQ